MSILFRACRTNLIATVGAGVGEQGKWAWRSNSRFSQLREVLRGTSYCLFDEVDITPGPGWRRIGVLMRPGLQRRRYGKALDMEMASSSNSAFRLSRPMEIVFVAQCLEPNQDVPSVGSNPQNENWLSLRVLPVDG